MVVIADNREPASIFTLLEQGGVKFVKDHLDVADFQIGKVTLERKRIDNLLNYHQAGKLYYQMKALSKVPCPLLLIEGPIPSMTLENKPYWRKIQSILVGLHLIGIPSRVVNSPAELVEFIKILDDRMGRTPSDRPSSVKSGPKSMLTKEESKVDILRPIPKVGIVKAKILVKKLETILKIALAPMEELSLLVGKASAKEVKAYLTT